MRIIYGNETDIHKIQGLNIIEFIINETIYSNGKIVIKSWIAKVLN